MPDNLYNLNIHQLNLLLYRCLYLLHNPIGFLYILSFFLCRNRLDDSAKVVKAPKTKNGVKDKAANENLLPSTKSLNNKNERKRGKCIMTTTQQIITIAVVVLGTMTTRFLPFIIFSADSAPEFVRFLGRVLPNAVIGLLVIYSLKDSIGGVNHCIPELIALAFIFILHKWKKNTLLSIAGGTILYMFLVQIVF